MWRVHASKPNASSVIIKEICGHGVDRSDSGIFIFDCGTTYLHQLAHQKVRWYDVLCAGISKIIFLHL
jgi:hypothetical protein